MRKIKEQGIPASHLSIPNSAYQKGELYMKIKHVNDPY